MKWLREIEQWASKTPEKLAVIEQESGRKFTYHELNEQSYRWACWLQTRGVGHGDRVVFWDTNSVEHLLLLFACARLGALFVPLNFRLSCDETQEILDRTEPKLCLGRRLSSLDFGKHHFTEIDKVKLPEEPENTIPSSPSDSDPALMLFTSGSTGQPKGVLLHGTMLYVNQQMTCQHWDLRASDVTVVDSPFFHTGAYNVLCLPLLSLGATVIISKKFDITSFFETIERFKVSVYFGVPTMFQMISEADSFARSDFSQLRFLISGGASCPAKLIQKFQQKNIHFKQGFGLTEVGPNCFHLKEADAVAKSGSIGQPMPHSNVTLLKEGDQVADVNEIGELCLAGDHVCLGYWQDDERFQASCYNGYFRTGDLARMDSDGFYYIVGRSKDMFISGGENVYPAEVEKKLLTHPEVEEAIVVPVPDSKWGEVGLALLRAHREIDEQEWRDYLQPLLSRYKQPRYYHTMKHFPLLANGKINRQKLKQQASTLREAAL